jgi:hypothetical protein
MSKLSFLVAVVLAVFATHVNAECANACNGHGKCVGYDMCICNRNWQSNDCSERVCLHGLAHVDTPKGDLDMDGSVILPDTKDVADNSFQYPYGTTEQFPRMQDSDYNQIDNSAHYYMECSNKGTCDRDSGLCECFEGYDGAACQRASCPGFPNSCSGHGVCKTAQQLAQSDSGNVYHLWNKDATMGCECDAGYFGADCSERKCKVGVDPLYLDDSSTVKYSIFDLATLTTAATADFDNGHPDQGPGYFAIRFFDHTGEDWVTSPIPAAATCAQVTAALESLPNEVIPKGTLECFRTAKTSEAVQNTGWTNTETIDGKTYEINYRMSIWEAYIYRDTDLNDMSTTDDDKQNGAKWLHGMRDPLSKQTELGNGVYSPLMWAPGSFSSSVDSADVGTGVDVTSGSISGYIYRIKFFGNPGKLREPEIITHLDGKRPSLMSTVFTIGSKRPSTTAAVITKVWTDGQQGEDKDYFADHCDGVTVTIGGTIVANDEISSTNSANTAVYELITGNAAQTDLLKKCLGDSDATSTNNVEIYDWDYGSDDYPHLLKLVRSVTSFTDGGYYVAVKWASSKFLMLNPFRPPDSVASDVYEVYTTKGTLSRVSRLAQAVHGFGQKSVYTTHTVSTVTGGQASKWDGDLSCEVGDNNGFRLTASSFRDALSTESQELASTSGSNNIGAYNTNLEVNGNTRDVFINDVITEWTYDYELGKRKPAKAYKNCLNKTDIITFINTANVNYNAPNMNLYTVTRLVKDKSLFSNFHRYGDGTTDVANAAGSMEKDTLEYERHRGMEFGTNVINIDLSTNWGTVLGKENLSSTDTTKDVSPFYVYKFVPHADSTYEYVAECSNRGLCDRDSGVCGCFAGYTGDSCEEQSSLAL